ncbi:hypothetical protein [Fluviispira multicolorata]|uniref:Uncharacterized protein n=1 Tax=Fluviispira multicolorata TaxID=2654512 RepID=A0A833JHM5_9BACT|nr:hypothetical protein [Fluviispira multicolorata]KAB8033598.1 hypothetical protein GCL57_02505 [Fluviispira multicolorata]
MDAHLSDECAPLQLGDTNTSKISTASDAQIEKMYKERFGFYLPILDRFKYLLSNREDWEGNFEKSDTMYHKNFPEFKILRSKPEKFRGEGFSCFFLAWDENHTGTLLFKHHNTVVYKCEYFWGNQLSHFFPYPKENSPDWNELYGSYYYYYFDLDSLSGKLFQLLYPNLYIEAIFENSRVLPILVFSSNNEKEEFNHYLKENKSKCLEKKSWDIFAEKPLPSEKKLKEDYYMMIVANAKYLSKFYQVYGDWKRNSWPH